MVRKGNKALTGTICCEVAGTASRILVFVSLTQPKNRGTMIRPDKIKVDKDLW